MEVELDYSGVIPEGFEIIEFPASTYLLFRGEPFAEENYEDAIREIWSAEKKYNPEFIGYEWDESNPRITWGKYVTKPTGETFMPVSVLAHHALVDGIQIARFYQNLASECAKLNKTG